MAMRMLIKEFRKLQKEEIDFYRGWIPIKDSATIPDGIIETLHKDGIQDICKVINGVIYTHDPKTRSRITHYKLKYP